MSGVKGSLALATCLGVALAGCLQESAHSGDFLVVRNSTRIEIELSVVNVLGDSQKFGPVAAGKDYGFAWAELNSGLGKNGCTVGQITAMTSDGRVLATFPPPLCAPTTVTVNGVTASP